MKKFTLILLVLVFAFLTSPLWADDLDSDNDGLSDWDEMIIYGTDPDDDDTDNDGLKDGEEVLVIGSDPLLRDSDIDGLLDGAEVLYYGTDPTNPSTDGDPYDDKQELTGTSKTGVPMPAYVKAPGNNVFVAAYPVIEIIVDDNISVEEIPVITFGTETWEETTVGYSVSNKIGSSMSAGTEEGHTYGDWIDVGNSEEDSVQKSIHEDQISTSEEKYWTGYSLGASVETEVGSEIGAAVTVAGPAAYAKVNASVKNTISAGTYGDNYHGTAVTKNIGGSITTDKIIKSSVSRGENKESTFSITTSKSLYSETTTTNTYSIATGQKWSNATTIDTNNAGMLRFHFWIKNTGSDIADEINGLRFNIKIGDNNPITYPAINEPAFSMSNLAVGSSVELGADIQITLNELKAIDSGDPILITVADYSYGAKELDYYNAWGRDVLVEIDNGIEDGDESIDYYMTWANYNETYFDILKRLNKTVQIGNPQNKRSEIELTVNEDYITSIANKSVSEWSWWNIYTQDLGNTALKIEDQLATRQSRLLLVYDEDSDHDFYPSRTEIKKGTNPEDSSSHPAPLLIAEKMIEDFDTNKIVRLKFENMGNFDAYGIEAVLYSPDNTTAISDSFIGGGGRIEEGRVFQPDDVFIYTENSVDCTEPVVLVRYNDPQGSYVFMTLLKNSSTPFSGEDRYYLMQYVDLSITTPTHFCYSQNNDTVIYFNNPGVTISDAHISISYMFLDGSMIHQSEINGNLNTGPNIFHDVWSPSLDLPETIVGNQIKIMVVISDYQGIEIAYDLSKSRILPYAPEQIIDTFSDGDTEKYLSFSENLVQTVYLKVPHDRNILNAYMCISGDLSDNESCSVYDNMGDNVINHDLWDVSDNITYSGNGDMRQLVSEQDGHINLEAYSFSRGGASTTFIKTNKLAFNHEISKYAISVSLSSSHEGSGSVSSAEINLFGNNFSPDGSSEWVISRKDMFGNMWDIYKNGVFQQVIQRNANTISINCYANAPFNTIAMASASVGSLNIYKKQYPKNIRMRIGSDTAPLIWDYSSVFKEKYYELKNISTSLNTYIASANVDPDGYCIVPLKIYSDQDGKIVINHLTIITEPTLCDISNLDFVDPVDIADFSLFAEDFMKNGEYILGDINRNQSVDIEDLYILIGEWLNSCNCN